MEIRTIKKLEKKALKHNSSDFLRLGFAIFFLIAVLTFSFLSNGGVPNNIFLAVAALIGAYTAMNIGANDVANNVGSAVGLKSTNFNMDCFTSFWGNYCDAVSICDQKKYYF